MVVDIFLVVIILSAIIYILRKKYKYDKADSLYDNIKNAKTYKERKDAIAKWNDFIKSLE